MNKVIVREYVEQNYVHKDRIRKMIDYKRDLISQIETMTMFRSKSEREKGEIARLKTEIAELKYILED